MKPSYTSKLINNVWCVVSKTKNLIMWTGGTIAASGLKLGKSILPHWKPLCWPTCVINPSWKGPCSGKKRTKNGWVFLAHNKNLIMGRGGRIAASVHNLGNSIFPQWKQHGWPRGDINLSGKGLHPGQRRTKMGWFVWATRKNARTSRRD